MSRTKSTFRVLFIDVVPKMMEALGTDKSKELAKDLGINAQSISNFKKKGTFPIGLLTKFSMKHNIPMERLIGEKTTDGDGVKKKPELAEVVPTGDGIKWMELEKGKEKVKMPADQVPRRREEDIYYSQILSVRECGPEFLDGRQIIKLYLLKQFFGGECDLSKLKFLVQTEGNFAPAIFPGNILVINTEDRKITSAFYILSYGQDSYALRKLDPIDQDTVRVVSGTTETSESRDMPAARVKNLIVGRVVWIVSKV